MAVQEFPKEQARFLLQWLLECRKNSWHSTPCVRREVGVAVVESSEIVPESNVRRALALGLLLTLAQILFVCLIGLASNRPVDAPYLKLSAYFDAQWFRMVAEHGYDADSVFHDKRGNVAFFPAYPLLVRGVHSVTGCPLTVCLLVVSQLACWGFWTYFLLLLERHNVSAGNARFAAIVTMALPGSFFLVAGYSESLFLFSLLGYAYWTESARPAARWLGALHGIVMTATQIVGLPLAFLPFLRSCFAGGFDNRFQKALEGLLIACVALTGALAFFGYCQWRFSAWDLYMTSQEMGWGVKPNYWALLRADTYLLDLEAWGRAGYWSPDWVSRASAPLLVVAFGALLVAELSTASKTTRAARANRIGLFVVALGAFYLVTAGLYEIQYRSMIRKTLCCEVLMVLEAAYILGKEDFHEGRSASLVAGLLVVPSLVLQGTFAHRFLNGLWVA